MAGTEDNKAIVRRYVEAFNRGDLDALRALFTPDAVIQGVLGWAPIADALRVWRELHEGLGDELSIEAMAAEGDVVAVRYTERGRFVGTFRGQAPTGRAFELVAMEWFELEGGRIARRWGARDFASLARKVGLPPGPPPQPSEERR